MAAKDDVRFLSLPPFMLLTQTFRFISCQLNLALAQPRLHDVDHSLEAFWKPLSILGHDPIIGVRIGVARIASLLASAYLDIYEPS